MNYASTGKSIRSSRFHYLGHDTGLIVPIDHGLTIGPVNGLRNSGEIADWVQHPAICAVIAHKGMIERLAQRGALSGKGVILHLNGMSVFAGQPNRKEMVTSLETAAQMGVDGVSVQINFDGECDAHNLVLLGAVVDEARRFGLPVLTMLYDKVKSMGEEPRLDRLRHLIRVAIELGTDAIKLSPPQSALELQTVLRDAASDVDIYFAGGELGPDQDLLSLAAAAIHQGAKGLCVGRNVFQRPDPSQILTRLKNVLTTQRAAALSMPSRTLTVSGIVNALSI